jgi:hypothetical protein
MATIEKLFNFDDQLLGRQLAGQKDDFQMGQLAPGPWGLMAAGVNRIGRGLFNNNDDLLKEKAAAETALSTVQEQLGDDISDPDKLYPALIKELSAAGANPKSILQVQEVYANQKAASNKSTIETLKLQNELYKTERDYTTAIKNKGDTYIQKNQDALRKQMNEDENYGVGDLKALGFDDPNDNNIIGAYRNILDEALGFRDEKGEPMFESISEAKAHIAKVFRNNKNNPQLGYDEGYEFFNMFDDDELNTDMFRHLVRAEAGQDVSFNDVLGPPVDEEGNPLTMDGKPLEWTGKVDANGEATLKVIGE